jgi:hypothetical protein
MKTIAIVLTAPEKSAPLAINAAVVVDLLWAATLPGDRVEHIHARAGPDGFDVLFYHLETDRTAATENIAQLCRRAVSGTGKLSMWTVMNRW